MEPHTYEQNKEVQQSEPVPVNSNPTDSNMMAAPSTNFTEVQPTVVAPKDTKHTNKIVWIVALAVVIVAALAGGYAAGRSSKKAATSKQNTAQATASIKVPAGATVVSECIAGRGKQYVMPKDIPGGPLYNVYNGNVVGLEFMMDSTKVNTDTTMKMSADSAVSSGQTLWSLYGQKYDHIDAEIMPSGHAGFSSPHVMIDVMMISRSEAAKITCSDASSSSSMSDSMKM